MPKQIILKPDIFYKSLEKLKPRCPNFNLKPKKNVSDQDLTFFRKIFNITA